jgi:hypothetical protein
LDDIEEETDMPSSPTLDPAEIRANVHAAKMAAKQEYWLNWTTSAFASGLDRASSRASSDTKHSTAAALEGGISKVAATHRLLPGKVSPYLHKLAKPNYIDSHKHPYAVFRFHYRSKGKASLFSILGT